MKQNAKDTLTIIGARRYTSADVELADIVEVFDARTQSAAHELG